MSKNTKMARKATRAKIRGVMADHDKEVREKWKRPPLRILILEWFRPGTLRRWAVERQAVHEHQLRHAFRRTHAQLRGR